MNRKTNASVRVALLRLAAATLTLVLAPHASGQDFDLSRYTIDGGGDMFSNGGDFELIGGFWAVTGGAVPPACPGDLDGDGDTDLADLGILLADFGCGGP